MKGFRVGSGKMTIRKKRSNFEIELLSIIRERQYNSVMVTIVGTHVILS